MNEFPHLCGLRHDPGQPLAGGAVMVRVEVDADELAPKLMRSDKG